MSKRAMDVTRNAKRHVRLFQLGAVATLGALAGSVATRTSVAAPPTGPGHTAGAYVKLAGGVHPLARPENDLGRLEPTRRLENLAIHFKPSAAQARERDALVQRLTDPTSPDYHQWLTTGAYRERFGAKREDVARTVAWLKAQGFDTVDDSSPLGLRVTFAGTTAQVESAFRAELHRYKVGAETHYAMASAPSVPTELADAILGVYNTHDFYAKPMLGSMTERGGVEPRPDIKCPAGSPLLCPGTSTVFSPPDWKTMYDVPSAYDGTGVTIMVVGVAQFAMADVTAYRTKFLPAAPALNVVTSLVPNTGAAGNTQTGAAAEAILDVEWSSSLAPSAQIDFVLTGANDPNVFDAIFYAIEKNYGGVLSASFGGSEQGLGTSVDANVLGQFASAANVLGITFLAASGDAAATTGERGQNPPQAADGLYVSYPASMPSVTAVGGTQFPPTNTADFDSSGNALAYGASTLEEVWSEGTDPTALTGVIGGGGGISIVFPRPAYQTLTAAPACTPVGSLPVTGVTGAGYRQVPDVAFTAAGGINGAGILIECTFTGQDCAATAGTEKFVEISGTSASTPSFAAVVALANQAAGARLGNINTMLYQLPSSVFHDVTSGNNEAKCTTSDPGCPAGAMYGYAAAPGYDCASGLGSVNATNLVSAFKDASSSTTTLASVAGPLAECNEVSLSATVTGSGTLTGTVTFAFQTYLASGAPDLSWPLATVPLSGGTAAPGAPVTVPPGMVGAGKGVDLVAEYSGDPTHLPSRSAVVHVDVTPPSLCVTEGALTAASGATVTMVANGGVPPLRWYISQDTTANPSTGAGAPSIDETTGTLTAGTGQAGYTLVEVVDNGGAETFALVTVGSPTTTPWWEMDAGFVPNVCSGTVEDAGSCSASSVNVDGGGSSSGGSSSGGSSSGGGSGASSSGGSSSGGGTSSGGSSSGGTFTPDDGGSGPEGDASTGELSPPSNSSGCSCMVAPGGASPFGMAGALGLGLGLGLVARRRRRRS